MVHCLLPLDTKSQMRMRRQAAGAASPSGAVPYGVVAGLADDGFEKTVLREALGEDIYE